MINELYALSQSLENNDISVPVVHPWVKGVKKGEALLVNIDECGQVSSVEYCSPEQVATFWNIEESNKATFPKINIDPLWCRIKDEKLLSDVAEAGKRGDLTTWFSFVKALLEANSTVKCKESKKKNCAWKKDKWNRLYKFPHDNILSELDDRCNALSSLIHCFNSLEEFSEGKIDGLFVQVAKRLVSDLENGRLDCLKLVQNFLVGSPGAKSQPQITMIFNSGKEKIVVADSSEAEELSAALLTRNNKRNSYLCPLSGKLTDGVVVKFPGPTIPELGKTVLMSMNKAASCNKRYHRTGVGIFPVSSLVANRLDNVLRYITAEERRFKTWMPVTSGKWEGSGKQKKEKRDVLITYAEDIPALQNDSPLALLMGGNSVMEQRFETVSSLVCDVLRRNKYGETEGRVRIFVLRNITPGQSQVVLNDFCSMAGLMNSIETWRKAANNHPYFSIYLQPQKGHKTVEMLPIVPFPADLLRLLQYQWIREGTENHKLNSCSLITAYDLFFERGGRTLSTAKQTLCMLLQRLTPLLIGAGRAYGATDFDVWNAYSPTAKRILLHAISFIGIILFKLGYLKEEYMKNAGYSIGRLLSLTDCLHREYCKHVRNDDIPNQLLGNTILHTALDNPVRGLARLSERIAVYKAWIDRVHGEQYKLAGWAKKQMGIISEQLSETSIPDRTDDILKSQILLGYLAHTESNQENK